MRKHTLTALAIAGTLALAIPATALITAHALPARTITHVMPSEPAYNDDAEHLVAYGEAVKALRAAGSRGDDLLPHLIRLAEVDNAARLSG